MTTITKIDNTTYELKAENRTVLLTAEDVKAIHEQVLKEQLYGAIDYAINEVVKDETADINDYPFTYEELIKEIFDEYAEDVIENGNPMPSENDLYDSVVDLLCAYAK